jgi:LysM repeat protein
MKRKKLRATTARRPRTLGLPDEMSYEQLSEPNMKLSRALLIVLVLHVVAVAGIVAFNTIKTREGATTGAAEIAAPAIATNTPATAPEKAESAPAAPNEMTQVAVQTEPKPAEKTAPTAKPGAKTPPVPDSGKIYVVVKGDNPVTIARRLHVSYDALLELNQIDDPRKLQIGQKLHVPERSTLPKHKPD